MKNLNLAVIGAGYMGRFHAQKLAACAGATLAAVVDADPARAAEIAAASGAAHGTDHKPFLGGIDAACVAVPTDRHFAVVRDCLEAGVHVLVEKPIATTLEEADALLALAKTKGRILQVGHLQRFNPAFQALAAGGPPLYIDIERLAPFKSRGTEVDVVLDLMIHDLDLVMALARAPVERLSASGFRVLTGEIDIANARIEFADGAVASLSASRVSQSPVRKLRVFRHDSYVSADLQGQKLRHVKRNGAAIEENEEAFARTDELQAQAEAFLAAVRGERPPLVTGEQGRQALALARQIADLVHERLGRHAQMR